MDETNFTTTSNLEGGSFEQRFKDIKHNLNLIKSKYIWTKARTNCIDEEEYVQLQLSDGLLLVKQNITKAHLLQMLMGNLSKSKFISSLFEQKYLHHKDTNAYKKIDILMQRSKFNSEQNIERNQLYLETYEEKVKISLELHETYMRKLNKPSYLPETKDDDSNKYKSNIKRMLLIQNFIITNMNIDFNKYPELLALIKLNCNYS